MKRFTFGMAALVLIANTPAPVRAGMVLTDAGVATGFHLTTFADGFPFDQATSAGPLGIAFTPGGGVMVTDFPGNVRVFPNDTDGQSAASVPVAQNYGKSNAAGLAVVAGNYYMAQQANGDLVQVNTNGTYNGVLVAGIPNATGVIALNPVNGHLFVDTVLDNEIFDVNPFTRTKTLFVNAQADGLAVNATGTILYAALRGVNIEHVVGFSLSTGQLVFDSGDIPGDVDGIAIGTGLLAGNLFVNTNAGTLVEINLTTLAMETIAKGGSRGDFVMADPDGSLLITQTDSVLRLTPPPGGGLGGPGGGEISPEPASLILLGIGFLCLTGYGWRRHAVIRRPHRPAPDPETNLAT
jgi:hypothetical protein